MADDATRGPWIRNGVRGLRAYVRGGKESWLYRIGAYAVVIG